MEKKRILTGDRPTGKLHLGHYVGTIKNRVKFQNEYECFFIIADVHTLTTKNSKEDIEKIVINAKEMVLDSISAGINPENVTYYLQSAIPETLEIYTYLQSLISVSRLERVPSLKDMARDANIEMPFALLGYPVLQAADILGFNADLVPVGKDNLSHIEVTKELARKFNSMYGEVFKIPEAKVEEGNASSLIGTCGKIKMSKSAKNAIFLSDSPEQVKKSIMSMYTDPNRTSSDVPGEVEGNPVFIYHDLFNPNIEEINGLKERYKKGKVGDVEVKEKLIIAINNMLDPFRERRLKYEKSGIVEQIIVCGTQKARVEVQNKLIEMKKAMGITGIWNRIKRKAEEFEKKL